MNWPDFLAFLLLGLAVLCVGVIIGVTAAQR